MTAYDRALALYQNDEVVRAREVLEALPGFSEEEATLYNELSFKLRHWDTAEGYADLYEWIGQQVPIMKLTFPIWRLRWIVARVAHYARTGSYPTLLDVGCQKGEMTVHFGRISELHRVVGVDISPTCIADARTNPENTSIVEYKVGDAEDLPFDDDSFSLVIVSGLFEHVRDPDKALSEAKRVCAGGGYILGNTPLGGYEYWPEQYTDPEEDAAQSPPIDRSFRCHVRCWNPNVELMYEPEVLIAYRDMTGDPALPFACQGPRTGEWCFMIRSVK
jgi:SAM-dependent methyltransferase